MLKDVQNINGTKCDKVQDAGATRCDSIHQISESISCLYSIFCIKLPRKICEGCTNSLEKCVECANIY